MVLFEHQPVDDRGVTAVNPSKFPREASRLIASALGRCSDNSIVICALRAFILRINLPNRTLLSYLNCRFSVQFARLFGSPTHVILSVYVLEW